MSDCHSHDDLIHRYLDGNITKAEKEQLYEHVESCEACADHLQELKKAIAFVQSSSHIEAPQGFSTSVMSKLPQRNSTAKWKLALRRHPLFVAAAIFVLMMGAAVLSAWNDSGQVTVDGSGHFVVDQESGQVVVPEGEVIQGDLVVRNGELHLEGEVEGDVLLLNSEPYFASPQRVSGEIEEVNQALEWVWYHIKGFFGDVVSVFNEEDEGAT
ncbi:anti-sigma factor family protein [Shouchella shacheensis]|uniref:anti-sigma factor family protein n=1 Tax=Shouchella shacheensis TaxID=1649580 RepID=UPI00073FF4FD|nr:anti-sigma factor [Shouchella shacheensis]